MKYINTKVLWINIELEGLTTQDLQEEEKKEIKEEIQKIKKKTEINKVNVVFLSEYDEDRICDEEPEEI